MALSSPQPNIPIIAEQESLDVGIAPRLRLSTVGSSNNEPSEPAALEEAEAGESRRWTQEELEHQSGHVTIASEAERLRLTHSTAISTLDIRQIAQAVESAIPFFLLVLAVFTYHHFWPILMTGCATFSLHRCNEVMQKQVARRNEVQRRQLVGVALVQASVAGVIASMGLRGHLSRILIFLGMPLGASNDFWGVLFTVILCDVYLRLVLGSTKALLVAVSDADSQAHCRRRGGLISAIDYCVGVHRTMVPTSLWLKYFQSTQLPWLVAMCLSGLYLVVKATNVLERASLAGQALASWRGASYGTQPTAEELAMAPRECPICQDSLRSPIRLVCGHLYCEDCVEEWLARESTCPMCRTVVRRPTLKPRGDGATSLFPVLC